MAQFPVNPQRLDPYKKLKFRVKWDGKYVAGISNVSSPKRTTEVVEHRAGAIRRLHTSRRDATNSTPSRASGA
jgi:phage tail-like protein